MKHFRKNRFFKTANALFNLKKSHFFAQTVVFWIGFQFKVAHTFILKNQHFVYDQILMKCLRYIKYHIFFLQYMEHGNIHAKDGWEQQIVDI